MVLTVYTALACRYVSQTSEAMYGCRLLSGVLQGCSPYTACRYVSHSGRSPSRSSTRGMAAARTAGLVTGRCASWLVCRTVAAASSKGAAMAMDAIATGSMASNRRVLQAEGENARYICVHMAFLFWAVFIPGVS